MSRVTHFILWVHTGPALASLRAKQVKRNVEHKKLNRSGRWTERKKHLAVGKACMAIFWPTPDFTGTSFDSFWFWTETLTFACAVTSCTVLMETWYRNPGLQVMAQGHLALTSKKKKNAFYHCFDWKTWSGHWPNSLSVFWHMHSAQHEWNFVFVQGAWQYLWCVQGAWYSDSTSGVSRVPDTVTAPLVCCTDLQPCHSCVQLHG